MTERREERASESERRDDIDAEDVLHATGDALSDENTGATRRETDQSEE